ncbi:MAG TPA: hypothetical protein VHR45_05940 [Thermoanaerobaculia bacterium]|nr:hypothetical protein [Thermoanaerobaculia bacterium]
MTIALAATTAWLCATTALPAQSAPTIQSLLACPFAHAEVETALSMKLEKGQAADMRFPDRRDVGCMHVVKGSSAVFAVRQTWDPSIPTAPGGASVGIRAAPTPLEPGATAIAGDPDRASWKEDAAGDGGELIYTRGKVRTRVMLHGGILTSADAQRILLQLRRVP